MENSTKKTMSVLSSIGALILGIIEIISGIYNISLLTELGYSFYAFFYILDLVIGILLTIFASMSFTEKYRFNHWLSFEILSGLIILLCFQIYGMATNFSGLQIIGFLLIVFSLITKIIAMSIKDEDNRNQENKPVFNGFFNESGISSQPANENRTNASQTLDGKCKELKHLKELGVLTDEQYENAIEKVIKDYK